MGLGWRTLSLRALACPRPSTKVLPTVGAHQTKANLPTPPRQAAQSASTCPINSAQWWVPAACATLCANGSEQVNIVYWIQCGRQYWSFDPEHDWPWSFDPEHVLGDHWFPPTHPRWMSAREWRYIAVSSRHLWCVDFNHSAVRSSSSILVRGGTGSSHWPSWNLPFLFPIIKEFSPKMSWSSGEWDWSCQEFHVSAVVSKRICVYILCHLFLT